MSNLASLQFSIAPIEPAVARSTVAPIEPTTAPPFDDHLRRAHRPNNTTPDRPQAQNSASNDISGSSDTPRRGDDQPLDEPAKRDQTESAQALPTDAPTHQHSPPGDGEAASVEQASNIDTAPAGTQPEPKTVDSPAPAVRLANVEDVAQPPTGSTENSESHPTETLTTPAAKAVPKIESPVANETPVDVAAASDVPAKTDSGSTPVEPTATPRTTAAPPPVVEQPPQTVENEVAPQALAPETVNETANAETDKVVGLSQVASLSEEPIASQQPKPTLADAKSASPTDGSDEKPSSSNEQPAGDQSPDDSHARSRVQRTVGTDANAAASPKAETNAPPSAASSAVAAPATTSATTTPDASILASSAPTESPAVTTTETTAAQKPAAAPLGEISGETSAERATRGAAEHVARSESRGGTAHGLTDAERLRLVQRVSKAFHTVGDQGGHMRLRLSPPELGSVRLEVTVRNGVLSAHLEAENAAARDILLENVGTLRDRLAEQNIKLDHFDVDLAKQSSRQATGGPSHDGHPSDNPASRGREDGSADDTTQQIEPLRQSAPWLDGDRLDVVI